MRRTAGFVVPLVIIVALLAGFAIGQLAGGSSTPSPRIGAPLAGTIDPASRITVAGITPGATVHGSAHEIATPGITPPERTGTRSVTPSPP